MGGAYFAVDNARVHLQDARPDVRVRVVQVLLQGVEEAVAVGFDGLFQSVSAQDAHQDVPQDLAHGHAHCVALDDR